MSFRFWHTGCPVWIEAPLSLLGDHGLSPSAKVVLLVLSAQDTPFFTYKNLGSDCGLSVKEVRAALKMLRGEATSKRNPNRKWIRTERVKHGASTATRFTILHNLTKGKVYRQEPTLQKGSFVGTNLTKGNDVPTPESMTKGKVCAEISMTKGKVYPDLSPLTVKELNKFNSSISINTAPEDLSLFAEEEMEATKEAVPFDEIKKIYNDVVRDGKKRTGLKGFPRIKHLNEKSEDRVKAATECWIDEECWNRALCRVRAFFEAAVGIDRGGWFGRTGYFAKFVWLVGNKEARAQIIDEMHFSKEEPPDFTNKWGEFYETV